MDSLDTFSRFSGLLGAEMKSTQFFYKAMIVSVFVLAGCQSGYQTTKNKNAQKTTAAAVSSNQKSEKPPVTGQAYTVRSGDTLFGIAFRAGLNYRDVAAWNGIDEPYTIRIGQTLRLSPPSSATVKSSASKPTQKNNSATIGSAAVSPSTTSVSKPAEPMLSNINWKWPARGEIIGRFVVDDKTQQGINISGKTGQPINAAADGVVVYSGTGLIGYGELLIVKHNNEWISAYAHNSKRLVAEGVKVKAGQQIAEMGDTGSVSTMLHFEIRRNGKPVDPLLYLPER
jgi:lipoprotein NlpD